MNTLSKDILLKKKAEKKEKAVDPASKTLKNHTLPVFHCGLSVHREQKLSRTFKHLPLGGAKLII